MSRIRIHPDENRCVDSLSTQVEDDDSSSSSSKPRVLTVWKKSSMSFHGTDGFTVFDSSGGLAFRVENYTRKDGSGGGGRSLVLMDGSGKPLLTLKPQMLSLQHQWNGYRGEEHTTTPNNRVFTIRRPRSALTISNTNREHCEAEVIMMGPHNKQNRTPDYKVEGSFTRRNCKIRTPSGALVANIARKRVSNISNSSTIVLSDDVFTLVVQPGYDSDLIMGLVVVLDRISPKPFAPVLCSKFD